MTAVFVDSQGVKRNFLWQYDKGQTLILNNLDYDVSPEVHFTTSAFDEALVSEGFYNNGTLSVSIPDALLLDARKITVYLYMNGVVKGETVKTIDIFVRPRKKPSDYIYGDSMYVMGIGSLNKAVNNYLDTHLELVEDIVVDYTTVHLYDEVSKKTYMVGVNNNKLYIKEVS